MKSFLQYLRAAALYLAIVVGGLTAFLIVAPVFGYLPYSDRPGAGWHGTFPALSVRYFLANSWEMLQFGLFFLIAFAPAALVCAGLFYVLGRTDWQPLTTRLVAALASAFVTAFLHVWGCLVHLRRSGAAVPIHWPWGVGRHLAGSKANSYNQCGSLTCA